MAKRLLRTRRFLAFIAASVAGNYVVAGLSLGIGLLFAVTVKVLTHLSMFSEAMLFIAVLLIVSSLVSLIARQLIPADWLALPVLVPTPGPTPTVTGAEADERERRSRVVIHDAISLLEHQRGMLDPLNRSSLSPLWRGSWDTEKQLLQEERRYDKAVRATERAFQALGNLPSRPTAWAAMTRTDDLAAIALVDAALSELEAAL